MIFNNYSAMKILISIERQNSGDVFGIGKNTDNALGLGTWTGNDDTDHWRYTHLEKIELPTKAAGIAAKLGCSLAWNKEGWLRYFFVLDFSLVKYRDAVQFGKRRDARCVLYSNVLFEIANVITSETRTKHVDFLQITSAR